MSISRAVGLFLLLSPMLATGQRPELVIQTGHTQPVSLLKASRDGRLLATASGANVRLFELESGKLLRTLTSHAGPVTDVAFSPSSKLIATTSEDWTLKIWDIESGRLLKTLRLESGGNCVAFSPSSDAVACGTRNGATYLWQWSKGARPSILHGHDEEVRNTWFGPDGSRLFTVGWDGRLKEWSTRTGEQLRLRTIGRFPSSIAVSADGAYLAIPRAFPGNYGLDLLDLRTGVATALASDKMAQDVAFSPDGKRLAAMFVPGEVRIWNLPLRGSPSRFKAAKLGFAPITFSSNKELLVGDGEIVVGFNPASGSRTRTIEGYAAAVNKVQFSPTGRWLAAASEGLKTVSLWDMASGTNAASLGGHEAEVTALGFSSEGRLATGGWDRIVRLFDPSSGALLGSLEVPGIISGLSYEAEMHRLTVAMRDRVQIWQTEPWKVLLDFAKGGPENEVALGWGGQFALGMGTAELFRLSPGIEPKLSWRSWDGRDYHAVALSPDGTLAAAAAFDRSIVVRETLKGTIVHYLDLPEWAHALAFSPDSKQIAAVCRDNVVRISSIAGDARLPLIGGNAGAIQSVSFSPDGKLLAGGCADGTVRLWQLPSGKELCSLTALKGGEWAVVAPNGRFDASEGAFKLMHYVFGLEPVDLEQLKDAYYDPGLLGKLLGVNPEPLRPITPLSEQKLFPKVAIKLDAKKKLAEVTLTAREGGIGRAEVYLNRKLIQTWNPPRRSMRSASFKVDYSKVQNLLLPKGALGRGESNGMVVRAFNEAGHLASSRSTRAALPASAGTATQPQVWALFVGTSDYQGDQLDLRYAAKDAVNLSAALRIASHRYIGESRTHVTTLTTEKSDDAPTKANILKALEAMRSAKATDILVVYFAGHGTSGAGPDGDFHYLTSAARQASDVGGANREVTLTGTELAGALARIPALNRVLILDTCASGAMDRRLSDQRQVSGSLKRSWERIKDRSGTFLLAGCASDAVSYEATKFGHGLLTYSLLESLKQGRKLRQDPRELEARFVDVVPWLQDAVDRVGVLAAGIGGIQKPLLRAKGDASSFDVGSLTPADRAAIPLDPARPVFVQPDFEQEVPIDSLRLTGLVERALLEASSRGSGAPLAYWDVPEQPDAFVIRGRYRLSGDSVAAKVYVFKYVLNGDNLDQLQVGVFDVVGSKGDLKGLAAQIVRQAERFLPDG